MNQERRMTQEVDNDEITIDLTELFMALWSKLHIIINSGTHDSDRYTAWISLFF